MALYSRPDDRAAPLDFPGEHHASQLTAPEARQGAVLGHMRYVLGFGLAFVMIAFAAIYFFYS
jgi:hypothetical protein